MKIVFAVSSGDLHLLEPQTQLQEFHGGLQDFEVFLAPSNDVAATVENHYLERYRMMAKSANILNIQYNEVGSWPHGPNKHWCHTVYALDAQKNRDCWLWYEMDMWSLVPWAKALQDEYLMGGKRCLGRIVPTPHRDASDRIVYKEDEEMMMGCAIYPAQMTTVPEFQAIAQGLINGPVTALPNVRVDPFDLKLRGFFKKAGWTNSKSIGDRWNTLNYRMEGGNLVCDSGPARFKDMAHHDTDISGALLIHGCKDDSLAKLILSGEFKGEVKSVSAPAPTITSAKIPEVKSLLAKEPAPQQPPSLVLLQGLAGRVVTEQEHMVFLHNLESLFKGVLSVVQAEAPKEPSPPVDVTFEPDPKREENLRKASQEYVNTLSDSQGIGILLGKVEAILGDTPNIRLGALAKAVEVPRDDLRKILEANNYKVSGVSLWVKKAA